MTPDHTTTSSPHFLRYQIHRILALRWPPLVIGPVGLGVGAVNELCGGGGGGDGVGGVGVGGGGGGLEHGVQFGLSSQGVHALVELGGGGGVDELEDLLDEDELELDLELELLLELLLELEELELDFEVELDVGPVQSVTRVTV